MQYLVVFAYTILFCFIIYKLRLFAVKQISRHILVGIFLIKVVSGLTITYFYSTHPIYKHSSDIHKYYNDSKLLFEALYDNPVWYIQLVSGIKDQSSYLCPYIKNTHCWNKTTDSYYKATRTTKSNFFNNHRIITKFHLVAGLFSFGYLEVHTVFICFLSFLGLFYLFKIFLFLLLLIL